VALEVNGQDHPKGAIVQQPGLCDGLGGQAGRHSTLPLLAEEGSAGWGSMRPAAMQVHVHFTLLPSLPSREAGCQAAVAKPSHPSAPPPHLAPHLLTATVQPDSPLRVKLVKAGDRNATVQICYGANGIPCCE